MRQLTDAARLRQFMRLLGAMARLGLIEPGRLTEFFEQIAPDLFRYPAVDPKSFRRAVDRTVRTLRS